MWRALGLLVMAACFVSEISARSKVTRLDRDYSYVRPYDVLAKHVEKVLSRLYKLGGNMHPRIKHLYELLKKDHHYQGPYEKYGQLHHAWEILDQQTSKPKYDVNKLNRIYTTEADG